MGNKPNSISLFFMKIINSDSKVKEKKKNVRSKHIFVAARVSIDLS